VVVLKTSTVTLVLFQPLAARVNVSSVDDIVVAVPVRTVPVWVTSGTSTEVAFTTPPPACVPRTVTWSPTRTSLRPGELSPGSRNLVFAVTSTVTVALCQPVGVMVKLAVTGTVEAVVVRVVEATGAERTVPMRVPP
jgi:hypothetical protein